MPTVPRRVSGKLDAVPERENLLLAFRFEGHESPTQSCQSNDDLLTDVDAFFIVVGNGAYRMSAFVDIASLSANVGMLNLSANVDNVNK